MQQIRPQDYDLTILGGGSGGLTAARLAAALGARTLLIEKERLGGECLHRGCVPSKSLIHVARLLQQARAAQRFLGGPRLFDPQMPQVASYIQEVIRQVQATEQQAVSGVTVRFGTATFQSPITLCLDEGPLRSHAFLIATGSRPALAPIPGLQETGYLTNETVFDLTALPSSLAIIGGGPVGVEIGQAFARLGSRRVTILQRAERLLPREDPDVSAAIARALQTDGVTLLTRTHVAGVSRRDERNVLTVVQDQQERSLEAEAILLAVGREANVEGLNLQAAGVVCNGQGIVVNDFLRTSAPSIFALGDVIGAIISAMSPLIRPVLPCAMPSSLLENNVLMGRSFPGVRLPILKPHGSVSPLRKLSSATRGSVWSRSLMQILTAPRRIRNQLAFSSWS